MAVRVRLTRVGGRKNPIWRVVVADQRSPRDGRVIETIGRYNAQVEPSEIRLDEEDGSLVLELHVAEDDVGKVIGRNGRTINALRTVVRASSARLGRRVLVDVVD